MNTVSVQISPKLLGLRISPCGLSEVSEFVESHHYLKSVKGLVPDLCFKIEHESRIIGASIFGRPAMNSTTAKYSENGKLKLTELRRFVLVDATPRNTESFVLSRMFRELAKRGFERILSYADPSHGHIGTIYKATGFKLIGQTARTQVIHFKGHNFSTRSINRPLSDDSCVLGTAARRLRKALDTGEAERRYEAGKFIYLKELKVHA
jgi:hypothetical protein